MFTYRIIYNFLPGLFLYHLNQFVILTLHQIWMDLETCWDRPHIGLENLTPDHLQATVTGQFVLQINIEMDNNNDYFVQDWPAKSSPILCIMVWATLGGYSWSETQTTLSLSDLTNTWHMYSASLTLCLAPTPVLSTSILEVNTMKFSAVPLWK